MPIRRFPYAVPGIPFGGEAEDLDRLRALVRDLSAYAAGDLPSDADLRAAPLVSDWIAVDDTSSFRIAGRVDAHPTVGPGPAVTSRVYAFDPARRWIRTYSRLWRLGPPRPRGDRHDA